MKELDIAGCIVVADTLNCQKKTVKAIISGKGDYLLSVKANHPVLFQNIKEYIQDDELRKTMCVKSQSEKNRNRFETRTAYVTTNIDWIPQKKDWVNLSCIGAIHTEF